MTGWAASSTKIRGAILRELCRRRATGLASMQAFLGNLGGFWACFRRDLRAAPILAPTPLCV